MNWNFIALIVLEFIEYINKSVMNTEHQLNFRNFDLYP